MHKILYPVILLGLYLAGVSVLAQDERVEEGFENSRLRDKSAIRQETGLGVFTVGLHGTQEDEREKSTSGDIEVGRLIEFKNEWIVPRVFELETFFVNRVATYEDSLYESLGVGAGAQLSFRKVGEYDKWFSRFTAIRQSEYYQERYGGSAERTVFELTFGRSYSLAPVLNTEKLQDRLASYALVATIPASALENMDWSDANSVAFLSDYLLAHHAQLKNADFFKYDGMSNFNFILARSEVNLTERENRLLELYENKLEIKDTWETTFKNVFRRALVVLLREKCRVVFEVSNSQAMQAFSMMPDGTIQQDKAIDLDRMIETYLDAQWEKFKSPPN